MFVLQNMGEFQGVWWKVVDSGNAWMFVIGIMALVLIMVILLNMRKKVKDSILNDTKRGDANPRQFSLISLNKIITNLELDKEQGKMLEFVLKTDNVSDPARSLNSPNLLDRHFKRAYRLIEKTSVTEEELHNKLSVLFATRNIIETNTGTVTATSTRQIPENSAAVLIIGESSYPVKVISSRGDSLVIENPVDENNTPIQVDRGSKASLSFFTKTNSKGFSVESRILGASNSSGIPVIQLVHSGQIKKLSHRRFRRRQTIIATAFYFVTIDENAQKGENKLIVDKRRFNGNIMDISIGGCSIKTVSPVNSGQMLKIEFTRDDNSVIAALGEVIRTNTTGTNTIMHIKFLKIPKRSMNVINAMVYEYSEN